MGKVYRPPKEVGEAPSIQLDYKKYVKATNDYIQKITDWAKKHGSGDCAGELVRFQVADGYAVYAVMSLKPVKLLHVDTGDAYQYPYVNRLTASDLKERIRRERGLRERFAKGA